MDWVKARLTEGNTLRALGVLVAILGATRILDPATIGLAANNITELGALYLAFDAFVTPSQRPPST